MRVYCEVTFDRCFCREALEAGKDLIAMNDKISELVEDGVPTLLALELTRQVLDAEIPKSKPIALYAIRYDEEEQMRSR